MALGGPDLVEADLIRGQVEISTCLRRVRAVAVADARDPELGAEAPLRQFLGRRGICVVEDQAEHVPPAAGQHKGVVLVLPEDMLRRTGWSRHSCCARRR